MCAWVITLLRGLEMRDAHGSSLGRRYSRWDQRYASRQGESEGGTQRCWTVARRQLCTEVYTAEIFREDAKRELVI